MPYPVSWNSENGAGCNSEIPATGGTGISHIWSGLFFADIGFLQEPAYVELLECISKFALNFGVVIFISRVYHKVGTYLRCLLIALILFKGF